MKITLNRLDLKIIAIILVFLLFQNTYAQDNSRLDSLRVKLTELAKSNEGLSEQFETELNISNVTLQTLLMGVAEIHNININVDRSVANISVTNNFQDVNIIDLLVFLCKEFKLTIDFTGNILSFKAYNPPEVIQKDPFEVKYETNDRVSLDIRNQKLFEVVKKISAETGKNLVYKPGLENTSINVYTNNARFESAMKQLAISNGLSIEYTVDNFIILTKQTEESNFSFNIDARSKIGYEVIDKQDKLLKVNFKNTPIKDIINALSLDLNLNVFTASPLDEAGQITFVAKEISFDELIKKMFESNSSQLKTSQQNNQNNNQNFSSNTRAQLSNKTTNFTFKKEKGIYYFGTESQLSLRKVELIQLKHRSVELLSDPSGGMTSRRSGGGRNLNIGSNAAFNSFNSSFNSRGLNNGLNRQNNNQSNFQQPNNSNLSQSQSSNILELIPENLTQDLKIKVDVEQNSLYVSGSSQKINRLRDFLEGIDKAVPVVLIEVMIIEVSRSSVVETGISWGIGEEPASTQGGLYPQTDITLGANTINRVIGGFDGFGSFNLGQVVPNFFATIKAMEANGNLKIRSTPKLSTLSGHRATFSNGQTSYYTVTQQNIVSGNNPVTNTITNFVPIDAELGLTVKPLVSGDGQVTLDIFVIQSNFGQRIEENAPPDINSREFSSLIRVRNGDIVVLGGLEEQTKDDSGSGVPLLARIPVIKWLFSQRRREDSKSKLTILIKPTVIN